MKIATYMLTIVALSAATAHAQNVTLQNVPDFSQHANGGWINYCAPTAGTNVAYYFSNTYASLRQGNAWGPGQAADNGATSIIGGLPPNSPPPPAGSMAQLMGTTLANGTVAVGMPSLTSGLDQYMEDNWDGVVGGAHWNTYFLASSPQWGGPGPAAFWQTLQNEIDNGSGIVLAIAWMNGMPTDPAYDTPDDYYPDTSPEAAIGHAVTMVGYNSATSQLALVDPADNAGVHNWAPQYAWFNVGMTQTDLVIGPVGGVQATVYGAAITNIIPTPGSLALLGLALLTGRCRRR